MRDATLLAPTVSGSFRERGESLLARIAAATLLAVALVAVVSGLIGGELVLLTHASASTRRASLLSLTTAARMRPLNDASRATLARSLSSEALTLTVLARDRRPLPGAPRSPVAPDDPLLARHDARATRRTAAQRLAIATESLDPDGQELLLVALPLSPSRPAITALALELLLALGLVGFLAATTSLVVARDITLDVRTITQHALRMAQGEARAKPLPVHARDEVGRLVTAFNQLQRRFINESTLHRTALARIEDSEQRKEALIATLRHELRTPLNAILGFAEVLLSGVDGALSDAQREDVEVIARSGAHLLRLVDDVLDLSAMASGRYALKREPIDLVTLGREVLAEAEGIARGRSVTLALDAIERADVYADPVALRRAFTNLVVNAIEHAGGRVTLSVTVKGRGFAFAVSDNGPGIAAGDLRRLFKPYERGRNTESRGSGLGLAITLGLVELHGGALSANSEEGRGSTFTATLPGGLVPLARDDA